MDAPEMLKDEELLKKLKACDSSIVGVRQYMCRTRNPITLISVNKTSNMKEVFENIKALQQQLRIVAFVDEKKNDLNNPYMLVWRVVNNIDAGRDIFVEENIVGIDGTNKNALDGFEREWPGDVECTPTVLQSLKERGILDIDEALIYKFQL
jgi:4-hydroxy-3-polyprenylbenzoate decarboxylase